MFSQLLRDQGHPSPDIAVSFLAAFLRLASELKREYDNTVKPIISKLSNGIDSLPDELLAPIFQCVSASESYQGDTMQSIALSRRFRRVALSTRALWNVLDSDLLRSADAVATFVRRCRPDDGLHVLMRVRRHCQANNFRSFFHGCAPVAARWISFTLTEVADSRFKSIPIMGGFVTFQSPGELLNQIYRDCSAFTLHLPRLRKLQVNFLKPEGRELASQVLAPFPWTSPNLETFEGSFYLPGFSQTKHDVFGTLTSISLALHSVPYDHTRYLTELFAFLSLAPNLRWLVLELHLSPSFFSNPGGVNSPNPLRHFSNETCPLITAFKIRFIDIFLSSACANDNCIRDVFVGNLLCMPKLEQYSVDVKFSQLPLDPREDLHNKRLKKLLHSLLPQHAIHMPLLSHVAFTITFPESASKLSFETELLTTSANQEVTYATFSQLQSLIHLRIDGSTPVANKPNPQA